MAALEAPARAAVEWEAAEAAAIRAAPENHAPMAKKFSNTRQSLGRADSLKFPRKRLSTKSTPASTRNSRSQYVLGYSPDKPDATPGYHKLHLAVKQKDAQVQTREGFYLDR